ncbi:helix-turn-helix domain-containing protein [Mycoplasmopsis arginini]|uniref:helix-turn-helix domain-containing protein n=1 Tax=Mycoplasmopsis arginini TaxID=2094 RepID=UPI00076499B1|nr:helix-turn-helix transcriptional regulator [Mycoplasmopsis arginini]MCY2902855.1 helix-turn-helix transcriptional regulator [Mycoplasmopsis arginini QMP CG1-2758]MDI3349107.1 helix-turn-helix transcriptional regulator [Mycoplasmopsis arginini]MDI3350283.1 helix-turn-helix transcriptional regulator [Mycoplasmopsis arginini]MDI3350918.1 helix-turn-helix transcriptional regulator [Mycoplasmopsis arginini]MDI3351359.1 helix-turn-helix transcriptional regulator [Mycoplasmopsis arginini]
MVDNYADAIKELRNKMLLSQEEFAKVLGVSFASINRWENGKHEPTIKIKRKLRALFNEYGVETK